MVEEPTSTITNVKHHCALAIKRSMERLRKAGDLKLMCQKCQQILKVCRLADRRLKYARQVHQKAKDLEHPYPYTNLYRAENKLLQATNVWKTLNQERLRIKLYECTDTRQQTP